MQLQLAAANQIATNNQSRKHHVYAVGLCIEQVFSIRYDTIRLDAILDIFDEQFV